MSTLPVDAWIREVEERRASSSEVGRRYFLVPGTPHEPSAEERRQAALIEIQEVARERARRKREWRERTGRK